MPIPPDVQAAKDRMDKAEAAARADIESDAPIDRVRRVQLLDELQLAMDDYVEQIIVLFRTPVGVIILEVECEPFRDAIAPCIPFNCRCNLTSSCFSATKMSIDSSGNIRHVVSPTHKTWPASHLNTSE